MIKLELHRHWLELQPQAGFLLLEPAHAVNMWLVGHVWSGEDPGPDVRRPGLGWPPTCCLLAFHQLSPLIREMVDSVVSF